MSSEANGVDPKPRESAGGILGTALGLVLLFGSLGVVAFALVSGGALPEAVLEGMRKQGAGDQATPESTARAFFKDEIIPFRLTFAESKPFVTGEVLFRFEGTDSADTESDASSGADPNEIVLIEFSSGAPAAALFAGGGSQGGGSQGGGDQGGGDQESGATDASQRMLDWERESNFAWHTTLVTGELEWSQWRADYRIVRSFREGGKKRDSVRVNLCQPGRFLVLFAQWPENVDASEAGALRVVRTIEMLAPVAGPSFDDA